MTTKFQTVANHTTHEIISQTAAAAAGNLAKKKVMQALN